MSQPLAMTKVEIRRAEGPRDLCDKAFRGFEGKDAEARGNAYLREVSQTAPKGGSYDKTDVRITFANGRVWEARFDVNHFSEPDNDTDLRKHVRDFLFFHLFPEQIPSIQALAEPQRSNHINAIRGMWTQEERADAAGLLEQIEGRI
jgi:hypothetical protein